LVTQKDDILKYRTNVLLQAGKLLDLLCRAEAAALMDKAQLGVFALTIKNALNDDNSHFFNISAYDRRKS
jgi:hypothetical protein